MVPTVTGRVEAAAAQIDEWVQPAGVPGAGIVVIHRGEVVAERYAGEARPGVPVTADTLFGLASVTKPIAAAVAMAAVEDGLVDLDEPIDRTLDGAWPAVTLRDLLRHTSGVPIDLDSRGTALPDVPALAELEAAHRAAPTVRAPGTLVDYSNTGFSVLAQVVAAATGEEFWGYARRRVLASPALSGIVVRPTGAETDRIVTLIDAAHPGTPVESYNSDWWREMALPWGGAYGTPRALASFAAAFLDEGDGTVPLSWSTRTAMTTDQAHGLPGGVSSGRVWWQTASWGLGWEVRGAKRRHWTGEITSPRTYCHFGQAGTLVWADPELNLAVAVFTNRSVARIWGFILSRWLRLGNALAAAV